MRTSEPHGLRQPRVVISAPRSKHSNAFHRAFSDEAAQHTMIITKPLVKHKSLKQKINPTLASWGQCLWFQSTLSCTHASLWQKERTSSWHRGEVSSSWTRRGRWGRQVAVIILVRYSSRLKSPIGSWTCFMAFLIGDASYNIFAGILCIFRIRQHYRKTTYMQHLCVWLINLKLH